MKKDSHGKQFSAPMSDAVREQLLQEQETVVQKLLNFCRLEAHITLLPLLYMRW